MTDQLGVTKLALQAMDERWDNVSALTDNLPGVLEIGLIYADEFQKLLRKFPWTFAMRWRELTAISGSPDLPPHWAYALPYPEDAKKVWELLNPMGYDHPRVPFETGFLANSRKVLFCNYSEIKASFTSSDALVTEAEEGFIEALAHCCAARVAYQVTGSSELRQRLEQEAQLKMRIAAVEEANEANDVDRDLDPDWIRAR